MPVALLVLAAVVGGGFLIFVIVSLRERESRAARVGTAAMLLTSTPLVAAALAPPPIPTIVTGAVSALVLGGVVAFLAPVGRTVAPGGVPARRIDERDIMFARARLRPGTQEYERYYSLRPEHKKSDDRSRHLPGLLADRARLAEPVPFASARASFAVTEHLRDLVDGPVADRTLSLSPERWSAHVKDEALAAGALDVGMTRLQPYHVYTHVGRGTGAWGSPVSLQHGWAVVFTVEMSHAVLQTAPHAPVVAESARRYAESATIAVQLAAMLRASGHEARAHIDGNYRVIAPLVARDAGLGEIGRMGLLITPRHGPRVRLGVITTNLELVPDAPGFCESVLDFCAVCRKCADACPVDAIPTGDRRPLDGQALRWFIDPDRCYRYWCHTGTDCGRCVAVCPYSHPNNPVHNVVRRAIQHSGAARRALLWADDVFYGRRPGIHSAARR